MGPYLAQPITQKHVDRNESQKTKLRFSLAEMQGWRRNMEDASIHEVDIGDENALFAVFDGHGGVEVSKYVEKIFISQLKNSKLYKEGRYEEALLETFRRVDELIQSKDGEQQLKLIRKKNEGSNMGDNRISESVGCTANVVLITKKKIIVANAGDSRSVLCRNGEALQLSFDHKPENPSEAQRIASAGGKIINGRVDGGLNLSRSFGDFVYKKNMGRAYDEQLIICKPDVRQYNRSPKDEFILIGCDGIYERYVNDTQPLISKLQAELRKGIDGITVLKNLLDFLLAKDTSEEVGCDNMTCMIIEFI